jgi:hypothetical protein
MTGTVASFGAFSIWSGQKLATDRDGLCCQFTLLDSNRFGQFGQD